MKRKKLLSPRNMILMAMMAAIAMILMYLEFPIVFLAPGFYQLDFSEVPVLIGSFAMGPLAGVIIELMKILLHILLKGTSTAYVGEIGNFLVGCALILPASLIYRKKRTKKGAWLGMAVGTITLVMAGCLVNGYVLLPWYAANFFAAAGGMDAILQAGAMIHPSIGTVPGFVLLCVAPFNLIKGILVSLLTALLY